MKCPVCKGKKRIQEFDSRGLRQYTCRTCGGTGEVDKIKEEFDGVNPLYNDGWQAGHKSRDKEIKKLKEALINIQLLTKIKPLLPEIPAILLTTIYNRAEEALKEIT